MKSDTFYKITNYISTLTLDILEKAAKAFLNSYIGQGSLKWLINFVVTRLRKEVVEPFVSVGVIHLGYYYDKRDSKNKIKRLVDAKESENLELYLATLNSVFTRKL